MKEHDVAILVARDGSTQTINPTSGMLAAKAVILGPDPHHTEFGVTDGISLDRRYSLTDQSRTRVMGLRIWVFEEGQPDGDNY